MTPHQQAVLREQDQEMEKYFMTPLSGGETESEIMSKFYRMTSHPLQVTKTIKCVNILLNVVNTEQTIFQLVKVHLFPFSKFRSNALPLLGFCLNSSLTAAQAG